ncbi:MAG: cation:proton antiporter [Actinobacteria bacterium]|nr:cation:proton antiporter [Actinomycetota bacterium]
MLALAVIMAILFAWALVAGRFARWSITAPLAMVAAGIALTSGPHPVFNIELEGFFTERTVSIVLALFLFIDATEVPTRIWRRERAVLGRMLGIALPLAFLLAILSGLALFHAKHFWSLAVLATIAIPTDLAPAATLTRDRRIPQRLRDILNVESGLNDGLVAPVFLFCLAAAQAQEKGDIPLRALADAVPGFLIAVVVGAVIGTGCARGLTAAWSHGWTQPSALRLGVGAVPLITYGLAVSLHGNGFVAAFVAGAFFGPAARRIPDDALHLTEDVTELLSYVVWFVFGEVVTDLFDHRFDLLVIAYGLLAVTVIRVAPVMLSLIGSGIRTRDAAFLGWLGPRGLASIVFGLLAFIGLPSPDNDFVGDATVATVFISVVLHGLSYGPIAARYGRGQQLAGT